MVCTENQLVKFRLVFLCYQVMMSQYTEREIEREWEGWREREKKGNILGIYLVLVFLKRVKGIQIS